MKRIFFFALALPACHTSHSVPLSHRPSELTCPSETALDACHVDGDCSDGGVCQCGVPATASAGATPNLCLPPGNCQIDSDCPFPYCSSSSVGCGTTFSYYCHTPDDDCDNDTDCRTLQFCEYAPTAGKWECVNATGCE